MNTALPSFSTPRRVWPVLLVWLGAAFLMHQLDALGDLASLAMVLLLASALSSVWLPLTASVAVSGLALLAFNWFFVPPRGTLVVELRQHILLLLVMLVTSTLIAALVSRMRRRAQEARRHARRSEQLRLWGDTLRTPSDPHLFGAELQRLLRECAGPEGQVLDIALLLLPGDPPPQRDDDSAQWLGDTDLNERAGLWLCLRQSQAMGPDTGRHEEQSAWYLPMRGPGQSHGAALIRWPRHQAPGTDVRPHAQALCDQMGLALFQAQTLRSQRQAIESSQLQNVRNALLTAVSHDYRTPLATILGAASSLLEQGERLDPGQQRRLAQTIAEQAEQLSRLTTNTLQLARLDAPGVVLTRDWESAEDLVGTVLRRARQREPARRIQGRLEPDLPLLHCDAILMTQMLDNLVDNALQYSPSDEPVELLVRRQAGQLVLAVRDRGRGVAPRWRERIFDAFERGELSSSPDAFARAVESPRPAPAPPDRHGAGVGLAVCRAIARAHGGEMRVRARAHGGSSFECWLPIPAQPQAPTTVTAEAA